MSQMSGTATGGPGGQMARTPSSTGRAVLLLAVAVIMGVWLLHALDDTVDTTTAATTTKTNTPQEQSAAVVPTTIPPATMPARSPSEVKVLVSNGTGVNGVASKVAGRLQPIGYQLLKPNNTVNKEAVSSVAYIAGYEAEAQGVATSLGIATSSVRAIPNPSPVADLQGAQVLVIVGNELATSVEGQSVTTVASGTTGSGSTNTTVNPLNGPLTQGQTNSQSQVGLGGTTATTSSQTTTTTRG